MIKSYVYEFELAILGWAANAGEEIVRRAKAARNKIFEKRDAVGRWRFVNFEVVMALDFFVTRRMLGQMSSEPFPKNMTNYRVLTHAVWAKTVLYQRLHTVQTGLNIVKKFRANEI